MMQDYSTSTNQQFVDNKLTNLDDAVSFEKAAQCMEQCQLPLDIVKRIMQNNIREVQDNLQNCIKDCKSGIDSRDDETSILFETEIHTCKVDCLEGNKEIMKEIEKQMSTDIPRFR